MEQLKENAPILLMATGALTSAAALWFAFRGEQGSGTTVAPVKSTHSPEELQELKEEAATFIQKAISIGAPVYNKGHHDMCYLTYRGTLTYLTEGRYAVLAQHFLPALSKARSQAFGEQANGGGVTLTTSAWTLREAMDAFLDSLAEPPSNNSA